MIPKRVMVVDDSVLIRKLVCDTFSGIPEIESSSAPNGTIALEKVPRINPDLVILDVEMPGMNGLETLAGLLKINPKLRVLMFSSMTEAGAGVSLEALSRGAADCLAKPTSQDSKALGMGFLKEELLPRVFSLLGLSASKSGLKPNVAPQDPNAPAFNSRTSLIPEPQKRISIPGKFDILAIASSTGGPNALHTIFESLPGNLSIPVVGVQHMPPVFTKLLAERLTQKSVVQVREAISGEVLEAGKFYLAPGDFHLELTRSGDRIATALHQRPPENSCRPAADVLFRSVAKYFGNRVLGLVLTGMGQDGLLGCHDLKQAGGYLVAQDEATSVVWGMPGAVTRAGLVDEILPISAIARRIYELLERRK